MLFCARHAEEIKRSETALRSQGLDVSGLVGDLTNREQTRKVAPLVVTPEQSFREAIGLFVYGPLRLCQAGRQSSGPSSTTPSRISVWN